MKILYISFADVSQTSGPSINERGFITAASQVPEVDWRFITPKPRNPDVIQDLPLDLMRLFPGRAKGVRVLSWLESEWKAHRTVLQEVRNFRPDLVISRPSVFPLLLRNSLRHTQAPLVLRHVPDGRFTVFGERLGWLAPAGKKTRRIVLQHLFHRAMRIQLMSEAKLENFRDHFPELACKARLHRNAVDVTRFHPQRSGLLRERIGIPKAALTIGYVGNFPARRGGRQVISSVARLREKGEVAHGIVVGDSGDLPALRKLASKLGVAQDIHFAGRVPFNEVPPFMSAFDVGLSILEPPEMAESPQKVLQYLACGRPVIANHPNAARLVEAGVASMVHGAPEEIAREALRWGRRGDISQDPLQARIRAYAEKHLCYVQGLRAQIEAWRGLIP